MTQDVRQTKPRAGRLSIALLSVSFAAFAQIDTAIDTHGEIAAGDLTILLNAAGEITGLKEPHGTDHNVSAQKTSLIHLVVEKSPSATARSGAAPRYVPTGWSYAVGIARPGETKRGVYSFEFPDSIGAEVTVVQKPAYATLELTGLANPNDTDIRLVAWGPLTTDITESVGELVGVVRNRDFAIAMLGVNPKTLGGWAGEYPDLSYAAASVGGDPWGDNQRAVRRGHRAARAVITNWGSALQSRTRDFTVQRIIETDRIHPGTNRKRPTPALSGAYANAAQLAGSKVAIFGLVRTGGAFGNRSIRDALAGETLDLIAAIELGEGMPHPIIGNVWGKKSNKAAAPYFVLDDLTGSNLITAATMANDVGWEGIYRNTCWGVWEDGGLDRIKPDFGGSADSLRQAIDSVNARRVKLGTHSLFTTVPTRLWGQHPRKLLVDFVAGLKSDITMRADTLTVYPLPGTTAEELHAAIELPGAGRTGYLRIGDELIGYRARSVSGDDLTVGSLSRGAWGTTISAHGHGQHVARLRQDPYCGAELMFAELNLFHDLLIPRLVGSLDRGIGNFSFDYSENIALGYYGLLAMNLVVKTIHEDLADNEDFVHGMANSTPYLWHLNSRYNWGEVADDILLAHQSYRWANQVYFLRNLFLTPRMMGWWNIRDANEWRWALSKSAAFDAGFAYFGDVGSLGDYDANLRLEIRDWNNAISAGAFDWPNRLEMQHPARYHRLDKVSHERGVGPTWKLSDWAVPNKHPTNGSRRASRYVAPQMHGFPMTNLAPDAQVTVSSAVDNSYGGALAVDTVTGSSHNREIASAVGQGEWAFEEPSAWIELAFDEPKKIRRIVLFDRQYRDQNVTGSSLTFTLSDNSIESLEVGALPTNGSAKVVDVAQKTVTRVRFTANATSGDRPGLAEFAVLGPSVAYQSGNLASGASVTGIQAGQAGRVSDGLFGQSHSDYASVTDNNAVLDLGGQYYIGGLNVWHYFEDARRYHDVVFEIADNPTFHDSTIVFNNDADNSLGLGAGSDDEYTERPFGKLVQFAPVPGRYVRLWTHGNSVNRFDHLTEVELYGVGNATTDAVSVSSNGLGAQRLDHIIDHSLNSPMANAGPGNTWVQIDLGRVKSVNSLAVLRDNANMRTFKGVVYRLSETSDFSSDVATVFHNDNDDRHGLALGESTHGEFQETENGHYVRFAPVSARYVRLYSAGSNYDSSNRYREVLVGTEQAGIRQPSSQTVRNVTLIAQTASNPLSGH